MKAKFQNTLCLSGFSSTSTKANKDTAKPRQKPAAMDYNESCTCIVVDDNIQVVVDALAKQPEFAHLQPSFQLFIDDVKHTRFKKFAECPTFTQYAADKDLSSFCDDLADQGLIELSELLRNKWMPKGVDSIQIAANNIVYVDEPPKKLKSIDDLIAELPVPRQQKIINKANVLSFSIELRAMRKQAGLKKSQVADKMGMPKSAVSKVERGDDVPLSVLQGYIQAIGGEWVVIIKTPDREVTVNL